MQMEKMAEEVGERLDDVSTLLDSGLPDRSCMPFPSGEREITSHAVTRSFIDRYA